MNIENYRIFVETVDTGNITKAAEKLGYTQSGVSRVIGKLEEEFQMPLVVRSRSGVTLVEDARPLYERMRELVSGEGALYEQAESIRRQKGQKIRIATFHTFSSAFLSKLLWQFHKRKQMVYFDVIERVNYYYILEHLEKQEVDVGFLVDGICAEEDFIPLYRDRYYVIMKHDHPLTRYESISEEQLRQYPFIMPDEGSYNESVQNLVQRLNNAQEIVTTKILDDSMTISMVESGFGISIVPGLFLRQISGQVVARPLEGDYIRTIGMKVNSEGKSKDSAVLAFADFVQSWFAKQAKHDKTEC